MKKEFSNNTTEVFTKAIFHNVPKILEYIDEIKDPRKRKEYSMRYLIFSEMLMFFSEGKSQRFMETAFKDNKYLENIGKIIKEEVKNIPDSEIYTDVFSKIERKEIEKLKYKINYEMIRNKVYENSKILNKYNILIDGTRFQKAHYEISPEWLHETKEGKTTWYLSMLEAKLASNGMAVSLESEMIKNEDGETKQDCEVNATKRILPKLRKRYPRLPIRIVADSLYPADSLIKICKENKLEYIFVLKDDKLPTVTEEFLSIASIEREEKLIETNNNIIYIMWVNGIEYKGNKVNIIRLIKRNKKTKIDSKWMWITDRKITSKNVEKIISCARARDYIENQGFREQKITSGIDLEHVYAKNIKAIEVIYTIIQITHLIMQIIEHSDICGEFSKKYGSVKVFRRRFFAQLTEITLNIEIIQIKIQIRFNNSILSY